MMCIVNRELTKVPHFVHANRDASITHYYFLKVLRSRSVDYSYRSNSKEPSPPEQEVGEWFTNGVRKILSYQSI